MKVFIDYEGAISEEIKEQIKKEEFVYYSNECGGFLVSDIIYKKLVEKYKLDNLKDKDGYLDYTLFDTLPEFLECHYEQKAEEFLGTTYYYLDFKEAVTLAFFDMENEETGDLSFVESDWIKDIEKYMKIEMSTYIMGEIRDELNDFKEDGFEFDYNILK